MSPRRSGEAERSRLHALAGAALVLALAGVPSLLARPRDEARPRPARGIGPARSAPVSRALDLQVRYPEPNHLVAPDSNFLFGSIGTGMGHLTIDGTPVQVEANGAFLAWLPVPAATRGDTAEYRIVAVEGADTASVHLPILRPPTAPPPGATLPWVDAAPVRRLGERWYREGEEMTLEVTGSAGASVRLEAGAARFPLDDAGPLRGTLERYAGRVDLSALRAAACAAGRCRTGSTRLPGPVGGVALDHDTVFAALVARDGSSRTRTDVRLVLGPLPVPSPVVRLREADDPVNGRSTVIVGRPTPFGPYRWRFAEGTVAAVRGRIGDRVALDLGAGLAAWVNLEDAEWLAADAARDPATTFDARVAPGDGRVDLRLGLTRPVPTDVVVTGPRSLRLVLYGTLGEFGRIAQGDAATGVRSVRWSQEPGPTVNIDIDLAWPVWGHRVAYARGVAAAYEGPGPADTTRAGGDGVVLELSIRRPPAIDPEHPLRGRRIAVDPGHPGAGSTGPTGLFEGDVNLAIARRLIALLTEAGAEPVVVRDDGGAVGLYERTRRARDGGAELLVSIHNNALPDGVRPLERAGTGTYYYHPQSAALAGEVQAGLVARLGLPDLGVLWGDLAIAREPWMPSVLAEGAFMMIPRHEMLLATEQFRERYAWGLLEGIERFLRDAAGASP